MLLEGAGWIVWMQAIGGAPADVFFTLVTRLGGRWWILPSLPFVWFLLPWRSGARVSLFIVLSTLINVGLKHALELPRPFHLREGLNLIAASGFGFPSGHAQAAVVYWGSLAREVGGRSWTRAAGVLIALIGLSRIYLGVHFPADVLGGWAIGAVLLTVFVRAEPHVLQGVRTLPRPGRIAVSIALPMALLVAVPSPEVAGLLGGLAGFAAGLSMPAPARRRQASARGLRARFPAAAGAFLGAALVYGSALAGAARLDDGTLADLTLRFGANLILAGWLSWLAFPALDRLGLLPPAPSQASSTPAPGRETS